MSDILGYNDSPIVSGDKDKLEMMSYVKGFSTFLEKCSTPITISVSGEWGSGKTSFMNLVQEDLKKSKFKFMTFPVWMYNTISIDDLTSIMFLEELTYYLIELLDEVDISTEDKEKERRTALKLFKRIKEMKFRFKLGVNTSVFSAELEAEEADNSLGQDDIPVSEARLISEYKNSLKIIIEKVLKEEEKLLIFIDDLDRLNPLIAIELLEIIKILLDLDNVIFVIAVDFEVVEQGVKMKYGQLTVQKSKDYFEKMIQVNYTMPVERYSNEKIFDDHFPKGFEPGVEELINYCVEPIPRKLKKFLNNYLLTKSMYENIERKPTEITDQTILIVEGIKSKDIDMYIDLVKESDNIIDYIDELEKSIQEDEEYNEDNTQLLISFLSNLKLKQNKQLENEMIKLLKFTKDMDEKSGVTLYKYENKYYDADDYTEIFKNKYLHTLTQNKKYLESFETDEITGNGSVRDVLTNLIMLMIDSNFIFTNLYSSNGNTMIWLDSNNEEENWRKSKRLIEFNYLKYFVKIDCNISRKDAYVNAIKLIDLAKNNING